MAKQSKGRLEVIAQAKLDGKVIGTFKLAEGKPSGNYWIVYADAANLVMPYGKLYISPDLAEKAAKTDKAKTVAVKAK